jgi:transcriptional regulator with XRE-family HTH domain/Zn-dependent peptidase ImmA (M78 family)
MASSTSIRWNEAGYQRISDAKIDGGTLVVSFENGDVVHLEAERALLPSEAGDWKHLRVEPFELVVPTSTGDVEISWLRLRTIADAEFARHLALEADDEARKIGLRIRALRERAGLSSKDLAERAHITPQSLSRIERGRHDVVFTTLQRILAAMGFGLQDLAQLKDPAPTVQEVEARLKKFGFDGPLVASLTAGLRDHPERLLTRLARIFQWSPGDFAGRSVLPLRASPALAGWFKHGARERAPEGAYAMYAHYLAALVEQAAIDLPPARRLPSNALELREEVVGQVGTLRFEQLLKWTWDQGIIVLPLFDPGRFHGACWLIRDRPVICLKQRTPFESRWIFDLAHELGHIALHLDVERAAIIEPHEVVPMSPETAEHTGEVLEEIEDEASEFAGTLLLKDPERLVDEVVETAQGKVSWLKGAVEQVAKKRRVEVDALANYLAYRLSLQGFNDWWGAAANLQESRTEAPSLARRELLRRIELNRLEPDDQSLLQAAIADREPR